ncbi:Pr6Pr family membrane protein [Confluentibacter lentus]|uniref:Pr6Pr family membrane protein n=1 Tax=Confluentibacter lentus TaxID=1699412 RepID=UPI000C28A461|nr:Pr6Pr family membrane protein [Confluentibacter lentus]
MQKKIEIIGFCLGWFAIITQFILIIQNRETDILETIIRFFSFFTILTNMLVALYFTSKVLGFSMKPLDLLSKKTALTALTAFILIVGLVYQFLLRHVWEPTGMQRLIDELLHSIIPLYMLMYWFIFDTKEKIKFRDAIMWLLYPLFYLTFILVRGHFYNYYPYPFLNIPEIGTDMALVNSTLILILMVCVISMLLVVKNIRVKIKG